MGLSVWQDDERRMWASVECDSPGCYEHVTLTDPELRAPFDGADVAALGGAAIESALAEGWRLAGAAWCGRHAVPAENRPETVAEAHPWLHVVNGAR